MYYFNIPEFYGIQQQKDSVLLDNGTAYDARNIDTSDGNLSVAKGYSKFIDTPIPTADKVLKLILSRADEPSFYVVTTNNIYTFKNNAWTSIYSFSTPLASEQITYLQTKIGNDDFILVATGQTQIIKIKLADDTATLFGTGLYAYEGTVSTYNAETMVVTLASPMSAEAQRRLGIDGIRIKDVLYDIDITSITETSVKLIKAPTEPFEMGDSVTIRGGGSDEHVNFIALHFGRLFSAGDPDAPSRLYWSSIAGDGRSIEDWLAVDASENASGGFVEVGDNSGDPIVGIVALSNQIVIFKRFSVYRLYGNRPSNYTLECVEPSTERMSQASAIIKYDAPYYLTKHGIKYFNGNIIAPFDNGVKYIDRFINSVYDTMHARGTIADDKMYFTCKVNPESYYDDSIIVIDAIRNSYMIRDGFEVADITSLDGTVYIIDGDRYVCLFNDGYTYNGKDIEAYWIVQPTDFGRKRDLKHAREIYFKGDGEAIRFKVTCGENSRILDRIISAYPDKYVSMSSSLAPARLMEIEIRNVSGSYFSIQGGLEVGFELDGRAVK